MNAAQTLILLSQRLKKKEEQKYKRAAKQISTFTQHVPKRHMLSVYFNHSLVFVLIILLA
jgi:hypothetical protein